MLDAALELLRRTDGRGFGLQTPLQLRVLNSSGGRQAVWARLAKAGPALQKRLIVCIEGVEPGAPRSVLETAVAAVRASTLAVIARAPGLRAPLDNLRSARLSGVVLDLGDLGPAELGELPGALQRFAPDAQAVAPGLIAQSVVSRAQAVAAWSAGFTHVGGDVVAEEGPPPLAAYRFRLADLYPRPRKLAAPRRASGAPPQPKPVEPRSPA